MNELPNKVLDNAISIQTATISAFENCKDTDYCPSFDKVILQLLKELKKYRSLEEQGLLLKLPCKVGDTVWYVGNKCVNDYVVRKFIFNDDGEISYIQIVKEVCGQEFWHSFKIENIGVYVFFTQEEAEQALKKLESKSDAV